LCWWFGSTKTDESLVLSSGCAGGLIAPKLMSHRFFFRLCWWFGSTKTDESLVLSSECAGGLVAPKLMNHQFFFQGVRVVW